MAAAKPAAAPIPARGEVLGGDTIPYQVDNEVGGRPRTDRMGVSAASWVFESWGWAFREQSIEDFGIDAHVEPFDGPDRPSRQLLALQIKSGQSYFREATEDGWWHRGIRRHWHYWLGHVLPVVIILYNPATGELFWQHVDWSKIEFTGETGKLLIPRRQRLDATGRDRILEIVRDFRHADPLEESLPLLPPSSAAVLRSAEARPENTMMIAWQLAEGRHQPALTAATLLAAQPSWLSDGGGQFEAAIGAYANDHGHPDLARRAFELAAQYERADRDRLHSIAAMLAIGQSDAAAAAANLGQISDRVGLFPRMASAAMDDHGRPEDQAATDELALTVMAADQTELATEPTLLLYLAGLAVRRGELDEAVRRFEMAAAVGDPPLAAARIQLARALLARASAGSAVLAHGDLGRGQALALQARDDMRRWAGPSERAVMVLQQIRTAQGAFQEVIRLATPESEGGGALDREAADGEVAVLAAEAAAAMGKRALAATFASRTADPTAASFITAIAADPAGPAPAIAAAWRVALKSAANPEQQRRSLYQLAAIGELSTEDIADGETRGALTAETAQILIARAQAANGQTEDAVDTLREHRDNHPGAAELLIEVLEDAGRIDEALDECDLAINRFGDGGGTTAHNKLNILARAGRQEDAEAYATSLLASSSALAPEQRIRLRQKLIQNRLMASDFAAAELLSRDAVAAHPEDPEFVWALITAQANQGHMEKAAASYRQLQPALSGPELVPLWLELLARRVVADADVDVALTAAEEWPGSAAAQYLIDGVLSLLAEQGAGHERGPAVQDISARNLARLGAALRMRSS
jgi:tetratricopeptide (TPR) repeat protein